MATLATNLPDYVPGEMAHIYASSFQPGEAVQFQVLHNDGTPNTGEGHLPWSVVDGSSADLDGKVDGNIETTWYVNPDDSAGSAFNLTALGLASGQTAFTTFTDGNPAVDLQQYENLTGNWANGQANANQAKYLEGDVVPYWLEASNLTVGTTYGVRINLDYYQSTTDAGGFLYLDTYNDSIAPPQNSDDGTGGPLPALSTDSTFTFSDPLYANPGLSFKVYNADVVSVSYSVSGDGLTRFADVRFTPVAVNEGDGEATVNIYWGERLAVPNEVITTANPDANSKGAANFTGGSLQTKISGTGAAGTTWITPSNAVQLMPGVVVQGAISGYKWNDLDAQGDKDAAEPGLAGWTIQLYKDDGDNVFDADDVLVDTKVTADGLTDANGDGSVNAADLGYYKFAPVLRGTYFVKEVQQVGWTQSAPANNLYGPLVVSEVTPTHTNINFGNYQLGGISGQKFQDNNGDGIKNGADAGLLGWTIQLDKDANGTVDATTVTDANGNYSFTGLIAGTYRVREVNQVGWTQTTVNPNDVTVVSGTSSTGNNFGNFQQGRITGTKYTDITGNSFSADDTVLGGVTINLYQGNNANGALVGTTVTAADGSYSFANLGAGTYFVQETVPTGYTQTGGNAGYVVVVTSGVNSTGNNFDNFQQGRITGTKYTDITGNSFSADDTVLGGVTINLYQGNNANGALVGTTVTAGDGSYSFANLGAGTYFVQETVPTGYTQTGGNAGYVVVVTSGVNSTGNNFDNFQQGRITGTKYTDITGNSFSADDTVLGGVTINLYQGNNANGALVGTTVTAGDGSYSFANLGAGTYFVQETVPTGYTQTGGNAGYVVVVTSGVNSTGNNFDNFQQGRITGTKYTDITGNSFSADDTVLGGVTINLYQGNNANGALVGTTVTAGDGSYSFANLGAGTYFVQETVPTGYTQTGGNAGYVVVVTSGVNSTGNNFDNFQQGRITGTKYTDITGNSFSADDTVLGGVTINLYQGNNANGALVGTTVTAGDGSYSFANLGAGTYFVQETVPTGYTQTGGNAGYVVVVTSGVNSTGNNFDNFQQGRITGTKYTDITGNSFSADDTVLGGVTINLYQGNNANGALVGTTVTAADGSYSFANLGAGTYFVQETVPTGYTQTGGNAGYVVVVTSGVNSTGNNFDNFQQGRITGTKYTDITGNSFSADDTVLGGVTINLYQGNNANGALVGTTVTAGDGSYSFANLGAGTYFVQETVPTGYTQTGGNAGYVVVVTSGVNSTGNNFDNFQLGGINGQKFQDNNGDGIKNGADAGLLGWTIQLDTDANGTVDATTVTDANGNYSFTGLTAGTYRVREVNQPGWTQTTVNPNDVTVVSGTNSTSNSFGNFQLGAIRGMKFNDLDGDGVKDAGDVGLLGWTIQLDTDANGTVDATTVTDANGNYSFTGLTAGTYRVREVNQPGWTQTTVNPNNVTVVSGTNSTGNNFGNQVCEVIVIGPDKQNTATSLVRVVDKRTGEIETQFYAYEPNFKGGVRLATGDMDGDGVDEIITAPGRGRAPEIRVFRQDGTELTQFRTLAYAANFNGGVEVAVGDVNGDGKNDIVTVPTSGVTQVRVFYNNYNSGNPLADPIANVPNKQFDVFGKKFQGGADVVLADMGTYSNGATVNALVPDGKSEIVVANGPGMRSTIYVYDVTGTPTIVDTILPFDNKFKGGITLDAARINADLIPDLIVSAGNGGKSMIEIWDGRTNDAVDARLSAFAAFGDQKTKNAPVHAVAVDTNGDGIADQIVAVQGTDGASGEIRTFSPAGVLQSKLTGFKGSWNIAKLRCHESVTAEMDAFFAQLGA